MSVGEGEGRVEEGVVISGGYLELSTEMVVLISTVCLHCLDLVKWLSDRTDGQASGLTHTFFIR